MPKAVNSLDFWKERIKKAPEEHYSVYVIDHHRWERIAQIHKAIIADKCSGKILDAGCGYGRMSEWVKNYVGVDFSPDFIAMAQKKYPAGKFLQADLKDLPFKDKEFDWAVCISIKHMIEANLGAEIWGQMEKELKRVAKNILILEYSEPERYVVL